jgi:hypothetical protein
MINSILPIIFCLDVEPDPRELDPKTSENWNGFESAVEFLNSVRPQIEDATGSPANFIWFLRMDPQVNHVYGLASWVVQRYRRLIEELELAGDELGLHVHAWRWHEQTRRWVIDHGDQKWVEYCVRSSFRAYEEALGRPCHSFRFGDRWMNNETMQLLESLGTQFDLTIEPGIRDKRQVNREELVTGSLPDYVGAPRAPFRPSKKDFRRVGNDNALNLWSIPLSTGRRLIIKSGPLATIRRTVSEFRWRHQPLTLNLGIPNIEFTAILNRLVADNSTTYLAPVARSQVGSTPELRVKLKQNVEALISHPQVARFAFVKPEKAIALLRPEAVMQTKTGSVSSLEPAQF